MAVDKGGAYELLEAGSVEGGYDGVGGGGDELMAGASGCSSGEAVVEEIPLKSCNTKSIVIWNVAGALHNPNGITLYWYVPYLVLNAVLSTCASCTLI